MTAPSDPVPDSSAIDGKYAAPVAAWLDSFTAVHPLLRTFLAAWVGSWVVALSARVQWELAFTPVPITLQSLAVLFIAALCGRKLGALTVAAYLVQGAVSVPLFARESAGLSYLFLQPTAGYLWGMLVAGWWVGVLVERGWGMRLGSALGVMAVGTGAIVLPGALVLAAHVGSLEVAVAKGITPFLAGAVIKAVLGALPLPWIWRRVAPLRAA